MLNKNGGKSTGAAATMQVVAADRIARQLIVGFGFCDECGVPLSERQRIALLTAALLEFDGVQDELEGLLRVERLLQDFGGGETSSI
jgi:hypothetical protein